MVSPAAVGGPATSGRVSPPTSTSLLSSRKGAGPSSARPPRRLGLAPGYFLTLLGLLVMLPGIAFVFVGVLLLSPGAALCWSGLRRLTTAMAGAVPPRRPNEARRDPRLKDGWIGHKGGEC